MTSVKVSVKGKGAWWKCLEDYLTPLETSEKAAVFKEGEITVIVGPDYVEVRGANKRKVLSILFGVLEVAEVEADLRPLYGELARQLHWGVDPDEYAKQKARAERLERALSLLAEERELGLKPRESPRPRVFLKKRNLLRKLLDGIASFLRV